jgi:ferredoxin
MQRIAVIFVTVLLLAVICLQVLAALNIFPSRKLVQVCPVDAIYMQGGKASIDDTKCIGCRRCVAGICPPVRPVVADKVLTTPAVKALDTQKPATQAPAKVTSVKPATSEAAPKEIQAVKYYSVQPDKCLGCGLCTLYCPEGAISMVGDKAVIDTSKCTNCGICKKGKGEDFNGCPFSAISAP